MDLFKSFLRVAVVTLLLGRGAFAADLFVPSQYSTIQAAVTASQNGDTIHVAPGVYFESVNYSGRNVVLRSEQGPALTTIDAGGQGSVIRILSGEGPGAVLEGFTIRGGDATRGGGILIDGGSSPTIRGNWILSNTASSGAGLASDGQSSPRIEANLFEGNIASLGGGGMYVLSSPSTVVVSNTILGCSPEGINVRFSSAVTIRENLIGSSEDEAINLWEADQVQVVGNVISSGGEDGMFVRDCPSAEITSNSVTGVLGDGISLWFTDNADVSSNRVSDCAGSGIRVRDADSPTLSNNLSTGNARDGISVRSSNGVVCDGNTLAHNVEDGFSANSSTVNQISNSIVWGNLEGSISSFAGPSLASSVTYCNVEGGFAGVGNIEADPRFRDVIGGNFQLEQDPVQAGIVNPCVDGGDPASALRAGSTRTDQVPDTGVVDLGYHYVQAPVEVGTSFCFGDGGATPGCTSCPCGNDALPGSLGGCVNSSSRSARLIARGLPRIGADSLRFEVTGAKGDSFAILVSAANALPLMGACPTGSGIQSPELDGLRCVGGGLVRHGTRRTDGNGDVGPPWNFPIPINWLPNGWGPPRGPEGGLLLQSGFAAGQTRHFQVFYRELITLGCGTGQGTTNAVSVTAQ